MAPARLRNLVLLDCVGDAGGGLESPPSMSEQELTYGEIPKLIHQSWRTFPPVNPIDWLHDEIAETWQPQSILVDPEWEKVEDAGVVVVVYES